MMNLYPDRVITIRGSIENMVKAESLISSKLLECIERDMQQANMVGAYDHRRSVYRWTQIINEDNTWNKRNYTQICEGIEGDM